MDEQQLNKTETTLWSYVAPVWRRRWLILFLVGAVVGATYGFYDHQPRVYEANVDIYVGPPEDARFTIGGATASDDRTIENLARLLQTRALSRRVDQSIERQFGAGTNPGTYSLAPATGTDFIAVSASASSARMAAATANAASTEFARLRSARDRQALQAGIQEKKRQLATLPVGRASDVSRTDLQTTITQLEAALALPSGGTRIVDEAIPPAAASSPKPVRSAIFSGILALFVGIALAFGFERFDRRLRDIADIVAAFDEPLLAAVPHTEETAVFTERGNTVSAGLREPFRALLTNIQLMAPDRNTRRLLVTSGLRGEGKSTVVRNLAIVLREYGLSVAVVDADLRSPVQARLLQVEENPDEGLTTVLTGQSKLADILAEVPVDAQGLDTLRRIQQQPGNGATPAKDTDVGHRDRIGGLHLLSSGPAPANPQAVLAASRTRDVIDALADSHDIVLIDSPPLLAVSDPVPLISQVDAVVVVSRVGVSTQDTARRLGEMLARIPGQRWVGVVGNDVRPSDSGGRDRYGYGYGYGYGNESRARLEVGGEAGGDGRLRRGGQRAKPAETGRTADSTSTAAPVADDVATSEPVTPSLGQRG